MITDFFAASDADLRSVFPNWLTVSPKPKTRKINNPFTGNVATVEDWPPCEPLTKEPPQPGTVPSDHYRKLPHVELKRVDHVKLATLQCILCGGSIENALPAISRPALISPDGEDGLHRLSAELTGALAVMDDKSLDDAARKWTKSEEMAQDGFEVRDCSAVLAGLRSLAHSVRKADSAVYLYWSL